MAKILDKKFFELQDLDLEIESNALTKDLCQSFNAVHGKRLLNVIELVAMDVKKSPIEIFRGDFTRRLWKTIGK